MRERGGGERWRRGEGVELGGAERSRGEERKVGSEERRRREGEEERRGWLRRGGGRRGERMRWK